MVLHLFTGNSVTAPAPTPIRALGRKFYVHQRGDLLAGGRAKCIEFLAVATWPHCRWWTLEKMCPEKWAVVYVQIS